MPARDPSLQRGPPVVNDLRRFIAQDDGDDYRHRMITNSVVLGLLVALVCGALWIGDRLLEVRKTQDCVLSGKRNCANIHVLPNETRRPSLAVIPDAAERQHAQP